MLCVSCKKEIPDGKRFCMYCGAKQEVQPAEPAAEPAAEPVQEVIEPVAEPVQEVVEPVQVAEEEPVAEPEVEPIQEVVVLESDSDQEQYAPVEEPVLLIEETEVQDIYSGEPIVDVEETKYIPMQEQSAHQPYMPNANGYVPNNNYGGQNGYQPPSQPGFLPPAPPAQPEPPKKKRSAAPVIIAILLAVFAVAGLFFGSLVFALGDDIAGFFGFGKEISTEEPVCVTYLADDGLYFAEKDSLDKPVKIDDVRYDKNNIYYFTDSTVVRGNKVFYAQDVEAYGENCVFSIYMKDIKKNGKPVEIDTDVTSGYYAVDSEGKKVVYGKDSVVFYSDLERKYQIASDVYGWCVDDNIEKIMFLRDDGDTMSLCTAKIENNPSIERLASGITYCAYISDDMSTAVYSKDKALYIYKNGEESLVTYNGEIIYGDSGEKFYYITKSEEGIAKSTYFHDDYVNSDLLITEPDINDYQLNYYGFVYTSPEYYDALEEYNVKLNRDKVRAKATETFETYDLCYFDGNVSLAVCKDVDIYNIHADGSRVIFNCYDSLKTTKFNMSDIEYIDDFDTLVEEKRNDSLTTYFAMGSQVSREVEITNAENVTFTDDAVYYIDNYIYYDESNTAQGDLKMITVASDGTVSSRMVEPSVNGYTVWEDEDKIGYFKEENGNYCAKLYVDGAVVADKVFKFGTTYKDGKYIVMRNYDYDKEDGELCIIENGKATVIAPSSAGYTMSSDGNMFFATDLVVNSENDYSFSINYYDGEKSVLVAENAESWYVGSDCYRDFDKIEIVHLTQYNDYNNA